MKVQKLLNIVQGKDGKLFPVFCSALEKHGYGDAAKLIRQNLEKQQQLQQQQQQSQGEPSKSSSFRCIF